MRRIAVALAVSAVVVMLPSPARAQGYLIPNIGYDFGGDAGSCPSLLTNCSNKTTSYGVTFGGLKGGILGLEEDLMFAPDFFGQGGSLGGNGVMTLMTNLVVAIPAGPLRPYLAGGLGLMRTHVDSTAAGLLSFSNNSLGYNFGGGLMLLFPYHLGVRGDLRYFRSASDVTILGVDLSNTKLSFTRFSVGLVLHF